MSTEETAPGLSRFKQYTRSKQTIARQTRTLAEFLLTHVGQREGEECTQLMAKLAADRFTLAVVGEFKRGKSSLMNAIIGRDLLPTGVLPLTSAITVLKYGPRDRLTILKEGASFSETIPISSLAEYVTEKGNPGNRKKVARACLQLPLPFLRRGLEFVDTPGIGSAIEASSATTHAFLPQSDAVIFVTSVDTPFTQAEIGFLKTIREHVRKIFFVVNKIDLLGDVERQEVLDFVSETLRHEMELEEVRIFPVSSTLGLSARIDGSTARFQQSGISALQQALSTFLSGEKTTVFLVSILDKVLRVAAGATRGLNLLRGARETSREDLQQNLSSLKSRFQSLREERNAAVQEIRNRTVQKIKDGISAELDSFAADETRVLVEQLDAELSRSNWKPCFRVAAELAPRVLDRIIKDMDAWLTEQIRRLEPEYLELLRREWNVLSRKLEMITIAAGEVLGASRDAASPQADSELPIHWVRARPSFTNLNWKPRVAAGLASMPLLTMRSVFRKQIISEIHSLVDCCSERLREAFADIVRDALKQVETELEARALEMESRIVQAMHGKRLSKGMDGHWRIMELETRDLVHEIETLEGIQGKLLALRNETLQVKPAEAGELSEKGAAPAVVPPPVPALRAEAPDLPANHPEGFEEEVDFAHDLSARGCPVCRRMVRFASSFFAEWQYALAIQERAQKAYAASLGFCPLHTWQLEAMASPYGLSAGYPELMERLAADLARLARDSEPDLSASVRALVPNSKYCQVCHLLKQAEKDYFEGLAAFVQAPKGRKVYIYSQGVCLRHLGLLVGAVSSEQAARFLIDHAARRFAEISEDMQNYALKRDALRGNTRNPDEEDAYLRGIVHSVGEKNVCFPWELDAEV
jgi:GTP-binding protein EngB required for normal cell division